MNLMNPKFSSILKTPHKHPQISNTTQIQKKKKNHFFHSSPPNSSNQSISPKLSY